MVKTESKDIGGIRFTTTQLPAMRAYPLFIRLVKAVGPAAGVLMGADKTLDLTKLGPVLSSALSSLDTTTAEQIAMDALACTTASINGAEIALTDRGKLDIVFSGKIKTLFQAIAFACAVNFEDFTHGDSEADLPPPSPTATAS